MAKNEAFKRNKTEVLLWSIALPGFGQLLNSKYIKGIVFILLEVIINIMSRLNMAIVHSFQGDIEKAIGVTDYQWLMFYPCVYLFAILDAYRDAGGGHDRLSFLSLVLAAYLGTIGLIYSSTLNVMGVRFGPVFLPIIFIFLGVLIGRLLQMLVSKYI